MKARYAMYEGVPGYLVADPEANGIWGRFIGMRRDEAKEGEPEYIDRFSPHMHVRKVSHEAEHHVKCGQLKKHGPTVVALNHEEAERHILAALAAMKGDA